MTTHNTTFCASTFFAVVEKEGLRELVESSFNQLKR